MTIPDILKELQTYTGEFPMKAMKAAIEQREAITPELLGVLESVARDPAGWAARGDNMFPLFALYLLAQFREKRAYRCVVEIAGAPAEIVDELLGDTLTEGLSQILGSVYDGDPTPIEKLIEKDEADEFARGSALESLLVLEGAGEMSRDQVVGYCRSLFNGRLKRTHSIVWNLLVGVVKDLPAPELLEEVRKAYMEGLVDESFTRLETVERVIAEGGGNRDAYYIIEDAIAEMEWWASFHPEDEGHDAECGCSECEEPLDPDSFLPSPPPPDPDRALAPFVRGPKIGRNDPCPCGSGLKYKKCCGKT